MIIFVGESLRMALMKLFNLCIIHGLVHDNFSKSFIVLIVKDKNGKTDCFDNYGPISIVSMFSKVFELCISDRLVTLLCIDDLQFGFVLGKGCQKALFTLYSAVNFFTSRGSPVFMAAHNASKAFDRVNHFVLFTKLICTGVPIYPLNILMNWHLKLSGYVLWCGRLSSSFYVESGVRQGGINSLWLFNLYINDLIVKLRNSG